MYISGIRWREVTIGNGRVAKEGVAVKLYFHARDPRNNEFFEKTDRPVTFVVGSKSVVPVVDQIVRGMREGGVREAVCPPSQSHPAFTSKVLVYEIELVSASMDASPPEDTFRRLWDEFMGQSKTPEKNILEEDSRIHSPIDSISQGQQDVVGAEELRQKQREEGNVHLKN